MKRISRFSGVTLLELLVVMVIMVILVAIAVPSFNSYTSANRVQVQARDLKSIVALARSEAISRGTDVSICASTNGAKCDVAGNWSKGWVVFVDDAGDGTGKAGNGVRDGNETLIRVYEYRGNNTTAITDVNKTSVKSFGFDSRGYLNVVEKRLTLKVCEPERKADRARALLIDLTGRAVSSYDMDDNGIYEDINGDDLSC